MSDRSRVCPASNAGWLSTPVRKLLHNPAKILHGMVEAGQTAADLGCGPGFFTLPMAEMVGAQGRVIAVDLQAAMLEIVRSRAKTAGLAERIALHECSADSLCLDHVEQVDFALAFAMVHEVPDPMRLFAEVAGALRTGGRLLVAEPRGHVPADAFASTIEAAAAAGLQPVSRPRVLLSRGVLLERTGP